MPAIRFRSGVWSIGPIISNSRASNNSTIATAGQVTAVTHVAFYFKRLNLLEISDRRAPDRQIAPVLIAAPPPLRASGKRPRDGGAADKRDELPPPHGLGPRVEDQTPPHCGSGLCRASQQNRTADVRLGSTAEVATFDSVRPLRSRQQTLVSSRLIGRFVPALDFAGNST
jgi:hypothetical protein